MDVWLWLHLLAMAFFVGGQLFLAAVVVPVERTAPDRERLRAMARRFGYGSLIALAVLLVSGSSMASEEDLWSDTTLHVKLGLVALTAALVLLHARRPGRHELEAAIFLSSLVIVGLGVSLG